MTIWLDAHLSPAIAAWISATLGIDAKALRTVGLRDARDEEVFWAARIAGATVLTKDRDFVVLSERLGPPPAIIWITCGNTSNAVMRSVLGTSLRRAVELIGDGEALVEIGGPS